MLSYFPLSQSRKARFSCFHAFIFISLVTLILFISSTNVYSAQVTLAWNPNSESDIAGYKLYYGNSSGNYDNSVDVGNQTSYTIPDLVGGETYYIVATAYNFTGNESNYSEELIITIPIDTTPPILSNGSPLGTLPSGTTSVALSLSTDESATCRYSSNPGVDYSSMANTFSITGGTSHSTTISELQDGQTYNYYIRSRDSAGNANSNDYIISFSVALPDNQVPSTPTNLTSQTISSSQINLSWNVSTDNVGVTGYRIYRDGTQISTTANTTYQDTGLSPSTAYNYTVSAYDSAGNNSAQSSPASATTLADSFDTETPSIPLNLTATTISSARIDLSWNSSTDNVGVTGYRIYRDGTQIANTANTTYQDTGLSPSTAYNDTVSAYDAAGNESGQSTASQATTTGDTTPPTISTASVSGDTKVIITFSEPVDQSSATNVSNYSINNGIIVSGASLGSDLKTVTLTTSPHTGNGSYTLTVNNIKDRANIPNVIASNTQTTYTFLAQLIISNFTVASGKPYEVVQDGLQTGALVYIDRTYTFSTVPTLVKDATYIKTANDDKNSSGASFITFDVNQNVTVYVAHDDRITTKPSWMVSFSDTGDNLVTTDTPLSIFANDYLAGTITLGGNESGGKSMYTVIIAGQGTGPVSDTVPPIAPQGLTVQ